MKNHGVSNGLMYGLVSVVLTLIIYLISVELYLGWTPMIISFLVTVFFMIRACTTERNDNGGVLPFANALKTSFIVYVVGALLIVIFQYVLYNFIDPGLIDLEVQSALEMTRKMMEMMGAPEAQIEKELSQLKDQDFSMTLGRTAGAYAVSLLGGFIVALISAAITKRSGNV